jgi:hypothetical protein
MTRIESSARDTRASASLTKFSRFADTIKHPSYLCPSKLTLSPPFCNPSARYSPNNPNIWLKFPWLWEDLGLDRALGWRIPAPIQPFEVGENCGSIGIWQRSYG